MDVSKLMEWWPGKPHAPHRKADKVKSIQRSLDWKRVTQIAAYLLQDEIIEAPDRLNEYFKEFYQSKKNEIGREWPPRVSRVIKFQRSEFPTFSNVLIHVNGAEIKELSETKGAAKLVFDETDKKLNFSVIDGQHRINGAYLAICIKREIDPTAKWEIPAEIFLDLDPLGSPPTKQAQIFIDVNFYQKKVDKSLVADLFPTARGTREAIDLKERAQDIGRKLMLETGPLVGMIQIPGIKYGVKDVITLATLNGAIEDVLQPMEKQDILGLEMQTNFLAQCLEAWLEASGRFESKKEKGKDLDPQNVAYQGRILVSVITLIPAMIWKLKKEKTSFVSEKALQVLIIWLQDIARRSGLLKKHIFIDKNEFKEKGYLGSGGIGRFRDTLWAVMIGDKNLSNNIEKVTELAEKNRQIVFSELS